MLRLLLAFVSMVIAVSAGSAHAAISMRVMTWNVQGSESARKAFGRPAYPSAKVALVVKAQNPDVVGFQEICYDQLVDLVQRLTPYGYKWFRFRTTIGTYDCSGTDRNGAAFGTSEEGIAILAKASFEPTEVTDAQLDPQCTGEPCEKVLAATFSVGGEPVRVHVTHLNAAPEIARRQVPGLESYGRSGSGGSATHRVVMGDLNLTPGDPGLAPFASWSDTAPPGSTSTIDGRRLDYVFVDSSTASQTAIPNADDEDSDHDPVVSTLGDTPPPPPPSPPPPAQPGSQPPPSPGGGAPPPAQRRGPCRTGRRYVRCRLRLPDGRLRLQLVRGGRVVASARVVGHGRTRRVALRVKTQRAPRGRFTLVIRRAGRTLGRRALKL